MIGQPDPKDDNRPFPILADMVRKKDGTKDLASSIPWWLAEIAYKEYCRLYGAGPTLERIAERGGFGRQELISYLQIKGYQHER